MMTRSRYSVVTLHVPTENARRERLQDRFGINRLMIHEWAIAANRSYRLYSDGGERGTLLRSRQIRGRPEV